MRRRVGLTGPVVLAAILIWAHYRHPGNLPGLALVLLAALTAWPLLALAILFGVPALACAAIPRSWRPGPRGLDRRHIPNRLRRAVLAADRHRCAYCRSPGRLALDHVFPYSCGGLATLWNLVTLCAECNRTKSNYWVWRSGHVTYRPFNGAGNMAAAAAILTIERRARWNPLRWWRAAIALI